MTHERTPPLAPATLRPSARMSAVTTSVGLISGLNTGQIIDALIAAQRASVARLESRQKNFETTQLALKTLEASLLSVKTSSDALAKASTFGKFAVTSSDPSSLTATARSNAVIGATTFQPLRRATAHTLKTRGFTDPASSVGAGTITIARGGDVNTATSLSLLNGGAGVQLGTIRVTDRSGVTAEVDLGAARTVADVLTAINGSGAAVVASADGDRIVLSDVSGGAGNLVVRDLAGGSTAADLGIAGSVAGAALTGASVFAVSESFALTQIDDGNSPRFSFTGAELQLSLADGTTLDVELSSATTLGDVLEAINSHAGNAGKLTASLTNGRVVLQDNTVGLGTLAATDLAGANVVRSLGLDAVAAGATLTGNALSGGMNTVLLRNLRGGQGITQLGQISLTDRTGATGTIDLSGAESLADVISAINSAQAAGGADLAIEAAIDDSGLGITLRDTSGASASNLVVADAGGGTTASDLGIAVNGAVSSVRSGHLGRRYVSEGTSLAAYAADGKPVGLGNFQITDSAGTVSTVNVSGSTKTLGDVIDAINAASVNVTARLNDTGDGLVLIDEAAGTGSLSVTDLGAGRAARDLKLAGSGVAGGDGKLRIDGRQSILVTLEAGDTLAELEGKLDGAGAGLTASIFNDGSPVNPTRLLISATKSGAASRLRIDDGGLGLGLSTVVDAQDALLRVGADPATGLLFASNTNSFTDLPGGLNVDVLKTSSTPVEVTVDRDLAAVQTAIKQFVTTYNQFAGMTAELTRFDPTTNTRGVLQGDGTVNRVRVRLDALLSGRYGTDDSVATLADLGVTFSATGTLVLDETRLAEVLKESPDAAKAFFSDKDEGFGTRAVAALDSLTDPFTGTFKLENDGLTDSIERIEKRVEQLDSILAARRDRLVRQFAKMEEVLGAMQSQQNALGSLANMVAANVKR